MFSSREFLNESHGVNAWAFRYSPYLQSIGFISPVQVVFHAPGFPVWVALNTALTKSCSELALIISISPDSINLLCIQLAPYMRPLR